MSYFGRNLKKIRLAKNISQAAFADLFKLKRGSIGAYEEGRAEAKIDTIIQIADYFDLTLDQLLKKELTINDIYHIGKKSKMLEVSGNLNINEIEIPIIKCIDLPEFIKKPNNTAFLNGLQTIKLPGLIKNSLAIEFSETMQAPLGFGIRFADLLIAQRIVLHKIDQLIHSQLYIVLTDIALIISVIEIGADNKIRFSESKTELKDVNIKAIYVIYQIISNKIPISDQVEVRLQNIENQLNKLLSR